MKREILGLVLCGGRSSRMGSDKALLVVRSGQTQLDYSIGLLSLFCQRVAIGVRSIAESSSYNREGIEAIVDTVGVDGPMASVLSALRLSEDWPVLVVACDMPRLNEGILLKLVNRRDASKVATAFEAEDGKPEPMCTIYEPSAIETIERLSSHGFVSLRRFLLDADIERIALDRPQMLASVNDRCDLKQAKRELS